jgi:catechol 2,3-dioxygenase-like lactoylglutathione lyase family enzyme
LEKPPLWPVPSVRVVPSGLKEEKHMNSHVSAILLGVKDMERSKRFYTEGLGWKVQNDWGISVFFVPHGGSLIGFYGRDGLAESVGVSSDGSGFSGLVFNYVVRSEKRVDEVMDEAKKAGGKILKPAAKLQWGGYGGTFADPDGYIWSIGYSEQGKDQPYAE